MWKTFPRSLPPGPVDGAEARIMAVSLWEVAYISAEVKVPLTPKKLEQEYSHHSDERPLMSLLIELCSLLRKN